MRTIRVTGKGQIKVKPDMTRITMTLTGVCKEYGEMLRRSSENTESLKEVLSEFGFDRSDLKTLSFDVDTEYELLQQLKVSSFVRCHQSFWVNLEHIRSMGPESFLLTTGREVPISRSRRAEAKAAFHSYLCRSVLSHEL